MSAFLGPLGAFTASITWAFASSRYAEVARTSGAVRVGLLRACSASLLWLGALACTRGLGSLAEVDLRHALCLAGSIVCSYALGDRIFFAAAARLGVASALAIATVYPLWAALYGVLLRGEPLGARRAFGVLCCLLGVSAIVRASRAPSLQRVEAGAALVGAGLALLTSFFWAGNAVLLKLGSEGIGLLQANALRFPCGVVLLLAQLAVGGAPALSTAPLAAPVRDASLLRVMAWPLLADTGLGSVAFVYGIANTDLALGATLSSLSPLVALLFGREPVSPRKLAAVCVTLLGVVLLVTTAGA